MSLTVEGGPHPIPGKKPYLEYIPTESMPTVPPRGANLEKQVLSSAATYFYIAAALQQGHPTLPHETGRDGNTGKNRRLSYGR